MPGVDDPAPGPRDLGVVNFLLEGEPLALHGEQLDFPMKMLLDIGEGFGAELFLREAGFQFQPPEPGFLAEAFLAQPNLAFHPRRFAGLVGRKLRPRLLNLLLLPQPAQLRLALP